MSMKKLLVTAIAGVVMLPVANADQYQYQLNADYSNGDLDLFETDTWSLAGTYYFNLVDDSKGPLAEAAFLSKSSSISLGYTDVSSELDGGSDFDSDEVEIYGRYVSQTSSAIVDLGYSLSEFDDIDSDTDFFNIGVGFYLDDTTTFVANYFDLEYDQLDADYRGIALDLKRVYLNSDDSAVNLEVGLGYIDYDNDYPSSSYLSFGGDYYFNKQFSIGASYTLVEGSEDDTFGVRTQYFFNNNVSMYAGYELTEVDAYNDDEKVASVGVLARF
jgi:Putative general bacterial porin